MEKDKKMLVDGDTTEEPERGSDATTDLIDEGGNENSNIKSSSDGSPKSKVNIGGGYVSGNEDANEEEVEEEDDDDDDNDDDDDEDEEE